MVKVKPNCPLPNTMLGSIKPEDNITIHNNKYKNTNKYTEKHTNTKTKFVRSTDKEKLKM